MNSKRFSAPRPRLRQPEYTGRNRCVLCTVVNLAFATALTAVVATQSRPLAAGVGAVALASIYLRGYLVPGTPELTKRYLPARVLARFGKEPDRPVTGPDPGSLLLGAGLLCETPDGTDLRLDPEFAQAWAARTRELLAGDRDQAALSVFLGVPADSLLVTSDERGLSAHLNGELLGAWESRTAFSADMAGVDLLEPLVSGWDSLSVADRSELAGTLRLFVESCPDCGGRVELGETTVDSCCSTHEVVAGDCTVCGVRLLELRLTDAMREATGN